MPGTLFQGLPVILRRAARFVITDKYDNESQGLNESGWHIRSIHPIRCHICQPAP